MKWNSATESPPIQSGKYLVLISNSHEICEYDSKSKKWKRFNHISLEPAVTHWMELPKQP